MNIVITKISMEDSGRILVEFQTCFGDGNALWVGQNPILGNSYVVEIEIPGKLSWGEHILKCNQEESKIENKGDYICLTGILLSVEENGFSVMKIENNLVLLEAVGKSFEKGIFIEVMAKNIIVYDTNI
ncbi:MAG TPA: hypothetical protein VKR06_42065 [Ktedonosporobacter sp.]|nr:hypothetical protein [Ktedonosporobacter sp.]